MPEVTATGAASGTENGDTASEVWRPGARLARMRSSRDYGVVILLLAGTFAFIAAAPEEDWATSGITLLVTINLMVALWTSGFGRGLMRAVPLGLVGLAAAASAVVIATGTAQGIAAIIDAALVAGTMAAVAIGISDQRQVNVKSISGALCIYLLIGMLFAFIFNAIALLGDPPFFSNGSDGTDFERLYFSYVTLATLGYGDYTAGTTLGRSLAVGEVLTGQLFLVTAVALIVGLLVSNRGANGDETGE
jgi:hypothetical protein